VGIRHRLGESQSLAAREKSVLQFDLSSVGAAIETILPARP
jgi:hypothetical protein